MKRSIKQFMVILVGIIMLAIFLDACNDGKDALTCNTIHLSEYNDEQQQLFQGIEIGTSFDYSQLDSAQKVAFNQAGLDSTSVCYTLQQ